MDPITAKLAPEIPFDALPGGDRVRKGLDDLAGGRRTAEALLVLIGSPCLAWLGIAVPAPPWPDPHPERQLWELLAAEDADSAHGRYNALVRRLVSFERAALAPAGRSRTPRRAVRGARP